MRLALTGGGTGGHVYPNLAVAAALRALLPEVELAYVGSRQGMERALVEGSLPFYRVRAAPLRGASPWGSLAGTMSLLLGVAGAYRWLGRWRPQAILATGGYVSVPLVVAGRLRGIPALLYLPDLEPGWAVRALALIVDRVAVTHERSLRSFPPGRAVVTGYPVRPEIAGWSREGGQQQLGLDPALPTLLAWGGSRGARSINEAVGALLPQLLAETQVVHLAGEGAAAARAAALGSLPPDLAHRYHLYSYLHGDFGAALAAADLAISRAGASVLGEYPLYGLPSILVPYPGLVRQRENAEVLAAAGAAMILADSALHTLLPLVRELLARPDRLASMGAAARRLARPGAAHDIADLLWGLGQGTGEVA